MRREWWLFVRAAVNFGLEKQHRWQTSPTGVINCVFHLSKEKVLTKEFVRFSKSGRKKKIPQASHQQLSTKCQENWEKKKKRIHQMPFQRQTQKEVNRQFPGWLIPRGACPVGLQTFQLYDLGKDRILVRRKLVWHCQLLPRVFLCCCCC